MRPAATLIALCLLGAPGLARAGTVAALALDKETGEPIAGATVVVTGPMINGARTEFTGGDGQVLIGELPPGSYIVSFYWSATTVRHTNVFVEDAHTRWVVGLIPDDEIVCWSRLAEPAIIDPSPRLQVPHRATLTLPRAPMPIGATDDWAGQRRLAGLRLPAGTGPITGLLIDDVEIRRAGYPARWGGAAGTITDLEPIGGTNEHHQAALVRGGAQRYQTAATAAGPIARDHVWFAVGASPWRDRARSGHSLLGRLHWAVSPEHQGDVIALATTERTPRDEVDVAGGGLAWMSRDDDHRLQLDLGLGGFTARHRPLTGAAWRDDRLEAHARVTRRAGYSRGHRLVAGVDGALDRRDAGGKRGFAVRALGVHLDDTWTLRPNLGVELGARWDGEQVRDPRGDLQRSAISPRLGAWYDWTREGQSRAFVHHGRYRTAIGAGRADPTSVDIGVAGLEYELFEDVALTLAYERRNAADGVVAMVRSRTRALEMIGIARAGQPDPVTGRRAELELRAVSSLDLCFANDLWLGAVVRAGHDQDSALTLGKTWDRDRLAISLAAELTGIGGQPGALASLTLAR